MQISLQKRGGQEPFSMEVNSHATVADLKEAISKLEPLLLGQIWSLAFNECALHHVLDAASLADFGIDDGSTLDLLNQQLLLVLTA